MKKNEALLLAQQSSTFILDYLVQMLNSQEGIYGSMKLGIKKIDRQQLCTLTVSIPEKEFERNFCLGIPLDHSILLYQQVMSDLWDRYHTLEEPNSLSEFYTIQNFSENFKGVTIVKQKNVVNFNFGCSYWYPLWQENNQSSKTLSKRR